jgi:hypothetical protein
MNKEKCVGIFRSIHEVLKIEEILHKAEIECDIIPLPRDISKSCGMGVVFVCCDQEKIKDISAKNSVEPQYFYRLKEGQFEILL